MCHNTCDAHTCATTTPYSRSEGLGLSQCPQPGMWEGLP